MVSLKNISLSALVERFGQSFKRFPLAMLFILLVSCVLIFLNHGGKVGDNLEFFLVFYPASGALLAVALSLLTEDFKSWRLAVAVQAVVHALWLFISAYLARIDRFSMPQIIAVSATVVAIGLAIFLICFYRKNQDIPFWNFSIRTVIALAVSATIGGALTLGLLLLVESLKMLFNLTIPDAVFVDVWAICMALLSPMLFLNMIPRRESKYANVVVNYSRFAKGVVQYLFLPLLGLYMITLYAYAAKILLEWTLPVGGVSLLVSGSMALMLLLIYLTYPVQHLEGNRVFKLITRCLPVFMLPLLALMTVAIGRRLGDYGITVSRLYLLVFNVWCYAVCLWLIFTRNRRIWLIPASFAVILFLISVGPQSIASVTRDQLKKEARNAFTASGITQFPLTGDQYKKWLQDADPKVARSIDAKLDYLDRDYEYDDISDLLGKDVITGSYASQVDKEMFPADDSGKTFSNDDMIKSVAMPQGYARMTMVDIVELSSEDTSANGSERQRIVVWDAADQKHWFDFDFRQFVEMDEHRSKGDAVQPLLLDNGEELMMFNRFYLVAYKDGSFRLNGDGILFTR